MKSLESMKVDMKELQLRVAYKLLGQFILCPERFDHQLMKINQLEQDYWILTGKHFMHEVVRDCYGI